MNVKYYVRALLCLYITIQLPFYMVEAQALKVGDAIPEELWSMPLQVVNHPEEKETISLGEYKDKLIILDFWATWCGPCIKSLNKLNDIQKGMTESFAVIPISTESGEKLQPYIQRKNWSVFSVVEDRNLANIFPHRYIPHYVWVHDGRVKAITGHEEVGLEQIKHLLSRGEENLTQKEDLLSFDPSRPLFFQGNGGDGSSVQMFTLISGPIKGLSTMTSGISVKSSSLHERIYAVNCSILEMYKMADERVSRYPHNRIILDVSDPERLLRSASREESYKNLYCYDRKGPAVNVAGLKAEMIRDLNHYFGLKTRVETRLADCYVLTSSQPLFSKGGEPEANIYEKEDEPIKIINYPVAVLIEYLNKYLPLYTFDETNFSGKIDLTLPNLNHCSIETLAEALDNYGLHLLKVQREVDFFVISENKD